METKELGPALDFLKDNGFDREADKLRVLADLPELLHDRLKDYRQTLSLTGISDALSAAQILESLLDYLQVTYQPYADYLAKRRVTAAREAFDAGDYFGQDADTIPRLTSGWTEAKGDEVDNETLKASFVFLVNGEEERAEYFVTFYPGSLRVYESDWHYLETENHEP